MAYPGVPRQNRVDDVVEELLDDIPAYTATSEIEVGNPWDELLGKRGFSDVEARTFDHCREWTIESIVGYVFPLSCSPSSLADEGREAFEVVVRDYLSKLGSELFITERQSQSVGERESRLRACRDPRSARLYPHTDSLPTVKTFPRGVLVALSGD